MKVVFITNGIDKLKKCSIFLVAQTKFKETFSTFFHDTSMFIVPIFENIVKARFPSIYRHVFRIEISMSYWLCKLSMEKQSWMA